MARRQYKVETDVDVSGVAGAFVFGLLVGVGVVYPALPRGLQMFDPGSVRIESSPIAAPLLMGLGLFAFFFLGVFVLNWLFIETAD